MVGGDNIGRTSNKCLTPYHLCNLLEFQNINGKEISQFFHETRLQLLLSKTPFLIFMKI